MKLNTVLKVALSSTSGIWRPQISSNHCWKMAPKKPRFFKVLKSFFCFFASKTTLWL